MMKRLYLLTTSHLEKELLFRDEEDFKVGMNYVAIQAASCPEVAVYVFILMSNHVHFVLKGVRGDVQEYAHGFKQRYSKYMQRKYGVRELLRRNAVDIKLIPFDNEAPEKTLAYVQVNCVAANICLHCVQYPWGTGNIFFNPSVRRGTRIGDLSGRARWRLLNSHSDAIPKDWLIGEDGYILPESYVDVKAVEAIFRTPHRMQYFLHSSSKAKRRLETGEENLPAFRDQILLLNISELCRSMFQKESFRDLSAPEQVEMARQIRFRFAANVHQIARVCGLTYAEAAKLFDSV